MRSFLRANYAVRLNKGIERKLIFNALARLDELFPLSAYQYVGMGSMWFVDFVLADRLLGIRKMISFELDRPDADRARTNIPVSAIDVRHGDCALHLSQMQLERDRTIAWLDFDGPVTARILDTITTTAKRMRSGSVLIVTVAAIKPLRKEVSKDQQVRELFFDAVPASLPPRFFDDELQNYPSNLAKMLHEALSESVRRGPGTRKYRPLFAFAYQDGQRMSTVGGMIVHAKDGARLDDSTLFSSVARSFIGRHVTLLEAPLLTSREKAALDRLLPTRKLSVRRARAAGVRISAEMLNSYASWFREYPLFAEIDLR